ncbi:DUF6878 family protein [Hyphomicrobium sp.]|uniref:DUF6878 family protein n=1 Tax=Hyphomicrobium sp. TaxID=82 RepID=UPI001D585D2D|nr:DUF6878 family protein [Hyphomicrobium sp.]MBY0561524.1 PcfJ domain-containing protein [Hyphomicrobium sp.]
MSETVATIGERLALLPQKTAEPIRQLMKTGQLTDDVVNIVLDAGELAGDKTRLVGFAAGFLCMRSQNIPVADTIKMAKQHGRRVNLAWSPARWKDEHNRLSRLATMKHLQAENLRYDMSEFTKHLPERFPGYVIQSSRRLGMEGLRQRHCVASYHRIVLSGASAIAAVFLDGQRWTVELKKTGNPEAPLTIAQLKGRDNRLPTKPQRDAIAELLGIKSLKTDVETETDHGYMDTLRRVLPVLRANGVTQVEVYFDGSGDSGSIESVDFKPDSARAAQNLTIEVMQNERQFVAGRWVSVRAPATISLVEAIRSLTDNYLNEADVDWYNNDGGYGYLTIDVVRGTVNLDISVRTTNSENAFLREIDILTGENLEE